MLRKSSQYSKRLPFLSRESDTHLEKQLCTALEHEIEHVWRPIKTYKIDRAFIEKRQLAGL